MKRCKLCERKAVSHVCDGCNAQLDAGEHPVICVGCRSAFNGQLAVTWVSRAGMSPELKEAMGSFGSGNVPMFVRETCDVCSLVIVPSKEVAA